MLIFNWLSSIDNRKGQDISPALTVWICLEVEMDISQQILHRFIYLRVLETVEINLCDFL